MTVTDASADTARTTTTPGFHALTVSRVDRLCDDAAAVTFAVPDELRDTYAFAPGQSIVLRREVDGVEHRRSYSICAPAGADPCSAPGAGRGPRRALNPPRPPPCAPARRAPAAW